MLINTFLDTEDFVHLYYAEDEGTAQGCGAGARMASKYPAARPPSPEYSQVCFITPLDSKRNRLHVVFIRFHCIYSLLKKSCD